MKFHGLIIALLCTIVTLGAQEKTIEAHRISGAISVDGHLDEAIWSNIPVGASGLTNFRPTDGEPMSQRSEVKLAYDDNSIYVAATLYENGRDSIKTELVARDNIGLSDFFGFYIDTYGNGTNAFEFILQATGVQFDARLTPQNEDQSWNAVWYSDVHITDTAWFAEIEIPFSALRFSTEESQDWRINFFRRRAATGEQGNWVAVDLEQDNTFLISTAKIEGLYDIDAPVRLSISPYAAAYANQVREAGGSNESSYNYSLGMDLKYGLTDAFTLDMTLIPDFNQVRSDDQVLNLSPAEVYFAENRAFFTEGIELFNKGGLFYSRRIGNGRRMLNGTKISGRTKGGLGIGLFNAIEAEDFIESVDPESGKTERITTAPLSNYNVVVLDKDLKNNSSITLTNTNVWRSGNYSDANVTGLNYNIKNKKQSFGTRGEVQYSNITRPEQSNKDGYRLHLVADKLNGSFVYGARYIEVSPQYDQNDLGFLPFNNYREAGIFFRYRDFDGLWKFQRFNSWFNIYTSREYDSNRYYRSYVNLGFWAQFPSLVQLELWGFRQFAGNDIYEARQRGRFVKRSDQQVFGFWMSSDNRKKINVQAFGSWATRENDEGLNRDFGTRWSYRHSDKISLRFNNYISWRDDLQAYVTHLSSDDILFGQRDQSIVSNVLGVDYTINNRLSFDLRVRHWWTKIGYDRYFDLLEDGGLEEIDYADNHNVSFNSFNLDANLRWIFAPGSELRLVWKKTITGQLADPSWDYDKLKYRDGLNSLRNFGQNQSFSISCLYFLDYARDIRRVANNR